MEEIAATTVPNMDALLRLLKRAGLGASSDVLNLFDATAYRVGFTETGCTARSGSTVGTGTAFICYVNNANGIVQTEEEMSLINFAASAVGTNKYIGCIRMGNKWKVVWEECA